MPYIQMQDVRLGMDRKRASRVAAELGSAWTIKNGHLTRGGDVARRKKFVKQAGSFPSTTVGLFAINQTLYTCGYSAAQAGNVPAGVTHLLTQHPTAASTAIDSIKDAEAFNGSLYSIIEFVDGNIYHYYGTSRVADWDSLATTIGSNNAVAAALAAAINNSVAVNATASTNVVTITSATAGTAFTIAQSTVNNGVSPLAETLASTTVTITGGTASAGVNKVSSITINGVNVMSAAVDWATSHTATATAVKNNINAHTSSPDYTATSSGAVITIKAVAGTGATPNGYALAVNVGGNVTATNTGAMTGGVTQVDPETITLVQTQANVAAVTEVLASSTVTITGGTSNPGTNKMSSITVDGVDIQGAAVDWVTSNTATATAIAAQINSYTSSPNYTATSSGPVITIKAVAGSGAGPNGFVVVTNEAGDVTSTHDASMAGGVTAVSAVAQVYTATIGGTFESADQFQITINGTEEYIVTGGASGTGVSVLTFKQKLYSTASSNLYFSALGSATQWISGVDYGFINMASQTAGEESLTVAQEYQGLMAIFSENNIRIWSINEDSTANVFLQTLQNTGTTAPGSVVPYGNNDVFYLNTSGIRSIKARDSSNAAYVSDVGTPIDTHVRDYMDTLTEEEIAAAVGIVEPVEGRFWLGIKNRIYVLSYFPSAKISAWSYYEVDFVVKHFAKVGTRIYVRGTESGTDYLYLYGGADNDTYPDADEDICLIELPYFSANNPAGFKELLGFDIVGINEWQVDILPDPANEAVIKSQGVASGTTYGKQRYGVTGVTPLFAVNLTCSAAGQATLSALAMHYNGTFEDG